MKENENENNYKEALDNYKQYVQHSEFIEASNRENSIIEINKKYKSEKLENEYNKMIIQRQYLIISIFTLLFLVCLLIGIGRYNRNKTSEKLLQIESMNSTLKRLASDSSNNEWKLKKLLIEKLNIAKKIALINKMNSNDKLSLSKVNEIFYGKSDDSFDWNEFSILLNDLYDNFLIKLERLHPELNDIEIQFCGLLKAGLNTTEIALLLNFSPVTIRIRKTNIRKKIKMKNGGDITLFIDELFKKSSLYTDQK
jgi:DNA-binding CsgD family transcriptional regulator